MKDKERNLQRRAQADVIHSFKRKPSKTTQKNFFQPNIAVLFFIRRRVIDKDRAEWRTKMIGRINPLTNKIEGKDNFSRNRYVLVAVRSPDHHGLFVGDLAGGDGVDLLDVLDLGNGLHGDNFYVSAIYDEWSAYAFLKSFLENFSFSFSSFSRVLYVRVLCVWL